MRALVRLLPLLLAVAAHPGAAAAQRGPAIPRLYVAPVYDAAAAAVSDTVGLRFRVGEGTAGRRERVAVAPSTRLAAADAARILARLPAPRTAATAADSFSFPARTLPPPRTGRVVMAGFTAPDSAAPPRPTGSRQPAALTIVRAAPRGEVEVAAEVSVTFSQPMVPLSTVAAADAHAVPLHFDVLPQPRGRWRWMDVRTLVYAPPTRLPGSTEFTVTVPAGTRSATGGRLGDTVRWTFSTQRLTALGGLPWGDDVRLDPLILIRFDQRIDRAALARHVHVRADSLDLSIPVRLATEDEVAADADARALAARGDSVHWIALKPLRPLPRDAWVRVTVAAGAPSAEGDLRTRIPQSWSFRTYAPLRLTEAWCPGNDCRPAIPITARFSTWLDTAAVRDDWVRAEPAIPGMRLSVRGPWLTIQGETRADTEYTLRFSSAIRDVHGQTLGEPGVRTIRVGRSPAILAGFAGPMTVLDPAGPRQVSVTSQNVDRLRIRIHRVQPSDWPAFQDAVYAGLRMPGRAVDSVRLPGREVMNRVVQVGGEPGEGIETVIPLDPALGDGPGHVVVGVERLGGTDARQRTYTWVQSTRMGLAGFADADDVHAWATSLVDGTPLPGVRVTVDGGAAPAATDAAGTARLPVPRALTVGKVDYLVAERDGDTALLPLAYGTLWRTRGPERPLWYSLTDRNLYRPGEEVRFKGWVRWFRAGKTGGVDLPRAQDRQVSWRVRDPRGAQIAAGVSALTALGGFDGAFTVPRGANLGHARIEFRLADTTERGPYGTLPFQVQEFRRPEFEVRMDAPAGPHFAGGSAEVAVRASYFAGGGLAGAPVEWTIDSSPASFTPPGWGAWRFGGTDFALNTRPFTREYRGATDADGRHAVRLDFDRADPAVPHTLDPRAMVTDVNRQPWATSTPLLVHPAEVYVGLRTERAWLAAGQPVEVEVVVVDLDGKIVAGRPVQVTAERMEWRRQGAGGWWTEVVVDSVRCAVVSESTPGACTFATDARGGTYRVTATVTDARGRPSRTRMSVWSWGSLPWRGGPGQDGNAGRQVRLVPDREEYAPGDTARILVQLPFWPARGLLTVRREGIIRTDTLFSDGPVATVSVPVTDADIPNLHVSLDAVGAYDRAGRRQPTARGTDFAEGEVTLRIPPGPRTLQVTATPADSVQAPDAPGAVDVAVRDAAGRPVADAEVAVVVVDEAVLALTGFQLRHPVQLFHPDWAPRVIEAALRPLVQVLSDSLGAPGVVWGVVIDGRTREPLAGAQVSVPGTELRTVTDAAGRFELAGVPPGRRLLRVGAVGKEPLSRVVEVRDEPMPGLRIVLGTPGGGPSVLLRAPMSINAPGLPAPQDGVYELSEVESVVGALQGRVAGVAVQNGISVRTNFAALALWAPTVRTDGRGRARVPFTLPSNLTRYRVMAVAVSGGRLYGMDESAITARQPLMVRPSAPRFLNFGDRFELPVVVQNQTDAPMDVHVAARGDGVAFADAGRRVTVPARDRVEVRIPGQALRAGTARVQVAAVSGAMADAAEVTLPVYTPATAEAFATYGSLGDESAVDLPLEVPDDALPGFGGLEVTTSSTALQELTDAFLYLVRYPYECAEQIASRLLAVAALRDVLAEFRAEGLPSPEVLSDSVARDLRTLRRMQAGDGGFRFWSGDGESWPYVSLHVTHALLRVRERGYEVPAEMLDPALAYVRSIDGHIPAWYPQGTRLALRAYAAYVLDRAGDEYADSELAIVYNAVRLDTIPLEMAGWLLAASADRPRFATQRAELLRIINNRATETASTATFATRYEEGEYLLLHSDRRTDAIVLEALLAADPQSPLVTKTVRGLLGHRTAGRWMNTQENGWVLVALDRYFRAYEARTPEFVARVWLGERFAGEQRFTGRGTDRVQLDVPMRVLAGEDPRSIIIGKEGPGRLYYRAGLRYAPRDLDLAPLEQGFAVERTYEAVDDTADVVREADGRWRVKAGARVRVTVTVTAPGRRLHVAVVDPLPAGFEPVNTALLGAEEVPPDEDADRTPWERGHRWWWGPWYEHQNLRDDRAEAFTSLLPAGTYTYTYVARATTPGLFIVPPPRAEEMYSPETFGRGASERVIVEASDDARE
jgi:uncharacterized protein YfaS (alpha-2-macroglobulin family)